MRSIIIAVTVITFGLLLSSQEVPDLVCWHSSDNQISHFNPNSNCAINSIVFSKFPPMIVRRAFESSVKSCLNKTGATPQQIELFNAGQDFTNLPKNHELMCYMHCQLFELDLMEENGTDIRYDVAMQNLRLLRPDHQQIYLDMGKKCFNRRINAHNPCVVAYLWNICLKRGDIKVCAPQFSNNNEHVNNFDFFFRDIYSYDIIIGWYKEEAYVGYFLFGIQ